MATKKASLAAAFLKFIQRPGHQFDLTTHIGAGRTGIDGVINDQSTAGLLILFKRLTGKNAVKTSFGIDAGMA